jgi:hypothetical protein
MFTRRQSDRIRWNVVAGLLLLAVLELLRLAGCVQLGR